MAAPRKWSDDVRQAIHELVNEEQRPATELGPLLEARGLPIPPLETIRDIARATRQNITDRPKAEQLRELTGLAVKVIHDGFTRIQGENGTTDPDETLKLVRSLRELEPLLTEKPSGNGKNEKKGTLGGLNAADSTNVRRIAGGPVTAHVETEPASAAS